MKNDDEGFPGSLFIVAVFALVMIGFAGTFHLLDTIVQRLDRIEGRLILGGGGK